MGLEKQATHAQMVEYVRCYGDVEYFIKNYVRVWRKETQDFGNYDLSSQLGLILDDLQKEGMCNNIIKARQIGASTLVHAFLAHRLMFKPESMISVGSNTLTFAIEHIMYEIRRIIEESPEYMQPGFQKGDNTKQRFSLLNGSKIQALVIGPHGLKGYNPDILYIDELAWCQHAEQFYNSTLGMLGVRNKFITVTTPGKIDRNIELFSGNRTITRVHKWFFDERFNSNLRWEKIFLGFHKNVIGTEVLNNQDPRDYLKLVKDGYQPHSTWTDKTRPAYNNDELYNQHLGARFYLHVNPEEEGLL